MRTNLKALGATLLMLGVAAGFEPAAVGAITNTTSDATAVGPGRLPRSIVQHAGFKSFKRFAQNGDAREQYLLGRSSENGLGVRENHTQAARWYRQAAQQGLAPAQYSLGRLYAAGDGVEQDYTEAMRWFRMAAAQGYTLAKNRIGVMYEKGLGVAQDEVEAYKWYSLAAPDQNVFALANRERLAQRLTPGQIAEGERRAGFAPANVTSFADRND